MSDQKKQVVKLKTKNYTPNSQIVEIKKAGSGGFLLVEPATGKSNTELELFQNKNFKSDEKKDFKDKKFFRSVEFRLIASAQDLVLYNQIKTLAYDAAGTPKYTQVSSEEVETEFVGNDAALDKLIQDAIFPYIILNVKVPSGEILKNDLASLKRDSFVKLVEKEKGETFNASLELDNAINDIDLSKLRVFEGSKTSHAPNGNLVDVASTLGYAVKDITWRLQVKFRGFEIEDKGTATVKK